jgi:hypothetical protein
MKIAIPTNDGVHIAGQELAAKGFHVFTIEFGEILEDEIRWKELPGDKTAETGFLMIIRDCSAILVTRENGTAVNDIGDFQTIPVGDKIITKIIWRYINEVARREANTCCCP